MDEFCSMGGLVGDECMHAEVASRESLQFSTHNEEFGA